MRYKQVYSGEWVQPTRKGYLMKCCDCGLVHRMDFRLIKIATGNKIQFRAFRIKPKKSSDSQTINQAENK